MSRDSAKNRNMVTGERQIRFPAIESRAAHIKDSGNSKQMTLDLGDADNERTIGVGPTLGQLPEIVLHGVGCCVADVFPASPGVSQVISYTPAATRLVMA